MNQNDHNPVIGRVQGIPVTAGSAENIAVAIFQKTKENLTGYICAANVHMVTLASRDEKLRTVMEKAIFVTPDGMPLVWLLKKTGYKKAERITGTDLTLNLCESAEKKGISVGFYGSSVQTIEALQKSISEKFPSLNVAFYESPPILPLHPRVDPDVANRLCRSGAQIIFVGLGCPKQEFWMAAYTSQLSAVLIGVGAAFDFIAGTSRRAPPWMQRFGLEWFYRLLTDPQRTWKRYVTTNPLFVWQIMREYLRVKAQKFSRRQI